MDISLTHYLYLFQMLALDILKKEDRDTILQRHGFCMGRISKFKCKFNICETKQIGKSLLLLIFQLFGDDRKYNNTCPANSTFGVDWAPIHRLFAYFLAQKKYPHNICE